MMVLIPSAGGERLVSVMERCLHRKLGFRQSLFEGIMCKVR